MISWSNFIRQKVIIIFLKITVPSTTKTLKSKTDSKVTKECMFATTFGAFDASYEAKKYFDHRILPLPWAQKAFFFCMSKASSYIKRLISSPLPPPPPSGQNWGLFCQQAFCIQMPLRRCFLSSSPKIDAPKNGTETGSAHCLSANSSPSHSCCRDKLEERDAAYEKV